LSSIPLVAAVVVVVVVAAAAAVVSFFMFVCHVFYLSYLIVVTVISCSAYSLSDDLKMFSIARPAPPKCY
jgi:hypothetical protein